MHLKCPTCISLAIFGEEKSTPTLNFFFNVGGFTPSATNLVSWFWQNSLFNHKLINPAGATSILSISVELSMCDTIFFAISGGEHLTPRKEN